jgi:hypothetical protein
LVVLYVVLVAALVLSSCAGKKTNTTAKMDIAPLPCVVLLQTTTPNDEPDDSVEGKNDLQAGTLFLYETIKAELRKSQVDRVIETAELGLEIGEIPGSHLEAINGSGREFQCDFIFATTLTRFKQREGGKYAVDSPASAAFIMQLIDARTGKSLWMATFSETQNTLMNNLFTFSKAKSRGFKWITVEELVEQGVREKLAECPYLLH